MNWQKLERTETAKIIQQVANTPDGVLFTQSCSEGTVAQLPFYRGFSLVRLTNYATLPSFTLEFLSDGTSFYLLDGSAEPLNQVSARGALTLTEQNVADYVDFFFKNVTTEEGDIFLIRSLDNLPFLSSLSSAQRAQFTRHFSKVGVNYDREGDCYIVGGVLYFAGVLLRATLNVQPNGEIEITDHAMLMSVPPTPHGMN